MLPNLPLSTLTSCSLKESEQSTGAVVFWSGKLLQWSAVGCSAPRRVLTLTFPIAFLGLAWTVETLQCAQPRPAHSTTGCCCKGIIPAISRRCSVISHPVQDASSLFRNTVGNSFVPNQLILSIFAPMLASQATASTRASKLVMKTHQWPNLRLVGFVLSSNQSVDKKEFSFFTTLCTVALNFDKLCLNKGQAFYYNIL